jgi:hypothetical protein
LAKLKPRTIVYIDGFNLYYGAVKGTPWKWLDLAKLFTQIRAADDVQCIRYFTAMVNGPSKPNQEVYLRALATTPLVDPVLGNFKKKTLSAESLYAPSQGRSFLRRKRRNAPTLTLRFTCSTTPIGI